MKFNGFEIINQIPDSWSEYFDYKEDLDYLKREASKLNFNYENVVVIGNGGSVTSFKAYAIFTNKNIWIIDSPDPALLEKVQNNCPKDKTIVVAISKSGDTLGVIEALMPFTDYRVVAITENEDGLLSSSAKKLSWQIIKHPDIPGRYSGATAVGLFPALLAGSNIKEIANGISFGHRKYKKQAYSLAKYYFDLENKNYHEVYISCYSWLLSGFRTLIIQLMHESVCKEGKGQTFYFSEAPESQHHTNQRFFGGKKNVIGTFITSKTWRGDKNISVPKDLERLNLKGVRLKKLSEISYMQALNLEYRGTKNEADNQGIPNVTIELSEISNQTVGELLAFWQLVAYYSAILRSVDPFSQPAVNQSKNITLEEIKRL